MQNWLFDRLTASIIYASRTIIERQDGSMLDGATLLSRSAQMAHRLVEKGVKPGDRVAVQVEKSTDVILLYLACLRVGAVFLPLNNGYTQGELDYFITDSGATVFVCDPANAESVGTITQRTGTRLLTLDQHGEGTLTAGLDHYPGDFENCGRGPDDLAAILYTSGTTGRSKGAMLSHDNLASNAQTLAQVWHFTADDILIHALPVFHTHGLFVATNVSLISGARMIFLPKFDAKTILALMPRATALMGVPTFYTRLLDEPGLTRESAATMRLFVSGSAPLLAETHRAFESRTGHPILERYGMTETNMNTSNPYDGARVPGTVGFTLPGVSVRIVDPDSGVATPEGEVGMIEVKGPNVFKGYWNMPEKTAAEFRPDGYFITGDLGRFDSNGYLQIVGRGKDLIISGGLNIYPKEVEDAIDALPGVIESAVIGLPHADFGEGVVAVIVPHKGKAPTEAEILTGLKDKLARFKQPKHIAFVDELPRNTMGKVQKNLLREQFKHIQF
jgi:malonyl-CoA/methylmalonyl-CoA synthetase